MFQDFRKNAEEALGKILKAGQKIVFEEPEEGFSDLATPICFELAPLLKKSPAAIAEELVKQIKVPFGLVREARALKGYLNFYLDYEKLAPLLIEKVRQLGENYGRGKKNGKIVLEHTSANPDGPLHIGHGRNAIIGDALARILRFAGYEVETQFYVNDMGKQLAVVVWGLRKFKLDRSKKNDEAIAEVYIRANQLLEENPENEKEISGLLKDYEAGDEKVIKEFENAAKYCISGITKTLERLKIKHDAFVWESRFVRDSSVESIVRKIKASKFARQGEVLSLDLSSFGIEKELVLARKDGTYLYTTRDIAYHIWKSKRGRMINIWGADHKLVAAQLKAVLKILGQKEPEFIIYEFISLPQGSMSTRKGIFISLDELVEESVKRAYAEVEKRRKEESEEFKRSVAESVGAGAVRYSIARVSPEKSMIFKWEEALDFERQGSPFIQYAHARACRILEKAEVGSFRIAMLTENEKLLIKIISKFPEAVEECASTRKVSLLASYVFELANAFHRFYMFEPVLKSEQKEFRLNLVHAAKVTLGNAMNLLGIEPLEKM